MVPPSPGGAMQKQSADKRSAPEDKSESVYEREKLPIAPRKSRRAAKRLRRIAAATEDSSTASKKGKRRQKKSQGLKELPNDLNVSAQTGPVVQTSRLLSLIPELRDEILSSLPPRDIARCRTTCHHLNDIINTNEGLYARPKIAKELRRLQEEVDAFEALGPVEDASSFMDAMYLWTKKRGVFSGHNDAYSSLVKLMTICHANEDDFSEESGQQHISHCTSLAGCVILLNRWFRHDEGIWQPIQDRSFSELFFDHAARFAGPMGQDLSLIYGLYDWIKYPLLSEPFREICGPIYPSERTELSTVPDHGANGFRLTEICISPYDSETTCPSDPQKEQLAAELDLPVLFDNMFCYYVTVQNFCSVTCPFSSPSAHLTKTADQDGAA